MSPRKFPRMLLIGTAVAGFLVVGAHEASAATIIVTSTEGAPTANDQCGLHEALTAAANNSAQDGGACPAGSSSVTDTIDFNISGTGPHTITPTSALPSLSDVVLDATTEPGYTGTPMIELNGQLLAAGTSGLTIGTAGEATILGFAINRFPRSGIVVQGPDSVVQANHLGTDPAGTVDLGNGLAGIELGGTAAFGKVIGGLGAGEGNLISGNGDSGIEISSSSGGPIIQGNRIGTTVTGNAPLGNSGNGIRVLNTTNVGVTGDNVIAANAGDGILFFGNPDGGSNSVVTGNSIGVGADGTTAMGNGEDGISILNGSNGILVGGLSAAEGNLIANNLDDGIDVGAGTGHAIVGNEIDSNDALGIDLTPDGVTPNDPDDPDSGANNLQNFPVIDSAVLAADGSIDVDGTLDSVPSTDFRIEVFGSEACDDSEHGEGAEVLGVDTPVTTDGNGDATFSVSTPPGTVDDDVVVTATASRLDGLGDPTDTSEFSACVESEAETFTVNDAGDTDDGACTVSHCILREAIDDANGAAGTNTIAFDIPGTGQHTIAVTGSQLPTIADPVIIDGFSDPDDPGRIEIDGSALTGAQGLVLGTGSSGSTVKGLVINDFGEGIFVVDPNIVIEGNYLGTDPSGNVADANATGIRVAGASATIGGTTVADRNVISGNTASGLVLQGSSAQVLGNYIGLGADGTTDVGNGSNGVWVSFANTNTIGGTTTTARNVISGNDSSGINISGTSSENVVRGNFIGVDAAGTTAKANSSGVFIAGDAVGNTVGGSTTTVGACDGACNVIAGNNTGVSISSGTSLSPNAVRGNLIGIDAGGAAVPNTFAGVSVNGGAGTVIGGMTVNQRNVISGNGNGGGIFIQPSSDVSGTQIIGNYIGLGPNGMTAMGNAANGIHLNGVNVLNVTDTTIQENVISANAGRGIFATNIAVQGITVQGNTIGLAADGSTDLGNGGEGFYSHFDVSGPVTVGGTAASARNVVSGNGSYGLYLRGLATYTVSGNRVGTDAAGAAAVPNVTAGMSVQGTDSVVGGDNATPGGGCSGACNLVSGNTGAGIDVSGTVEVQGNYVGTNLAGTAAIPNTFHGICECSTHDGVAIIGGTTAAQRNVVAGNDGAGIAFPDVGAINNEVLGNYIGIGADGALALGNGGGGVYVTAPDNQIGGPGPEANEIAHNVGPGVAIVGASADGNSILRNSIHDNGGLGIDLGPTEGVTPNDPGDADAGANNEQNFPELTGAVASGSQTEVTGTLNGIPSETFEIEIFSSPSCDASGNGEGETFRGTSSVTTNASGDGSFTATLPTALPGGSVVTATATDDEGNTSEFSACEPVVEAPEEPPPSTPPAVATCKGKNATIVGTDGAETLIGTPGADVIAGLGGNDVIKALGGKDIVCGGDGNDKINGGGGNDKLLGEAGNDKLKGAAGNDKLIGGPGKDLASGGAGKDKAPKAEKTRSIP